MKAKGYMGKVLQIDVGSREIEKLPFSDSVAEKYIGGSGLGARFLYDETTPDTKALDPENPLIFAVGPLTATPIYNSNYSGTPATISASITFSGPFKSNVG